MSRTSQILTISWEGIRVEIWFHTNSGIPSITAEDRLSDSSSDDSHPRQTRACRSSHSSASLGCVADLVFWHLPVRNLVQLKVLSKEWRAWCDDNLLKIAKERRKNESKSDWYFPLTFKESRQCGKLTGSWNWYGIHQGTKEQHTLPGLDFLPSSSHRNGAPPDLDFLPSSSHRNGAPRFDYVLEAVSGGLLVLRKFSPQDNASVLVVCNPLSKKWKKFPMPRYPIYRYRGMDPAYSVHTHLVLGDVLNEYKVIRVSNFCVNVYSSSTKHWVCTPYDRPDIRFCYSSSACFEGHVYLLKMMEGVLLDSRTLRWTYNLRIYDIESGRYVNKSLTSGTVLLQDCNEKNQVDYPRDPILVVCMGNLYAVSVSRQAGCNHVKPRKRRETYVANCEFHIFALTEKGRLLDGSCKHVVTVPVVLRSVKQDVVEFRDACRDYNCVARSSKICLAWRHHDFNYLEYDVVSGLHTTYKSARAHHRLPFSNGYNTGMAYTPCLDVEP